MNTFVSASFSRGKPRAPVRFTIAKPPKIRYPCRCRNWKCQKRRTLNQHPDAYVREPKCKRCKSALRIDRHRMKREWHVRPCRCYGYSFPHARGRGYCDHNRKLTAADLQHREETRGWR